MNSSLSSLFLERVFLYSSYSCHFFLFLLSSLCHWCTDLLCCCFYHCLSFEHNRALLFEHFIPTKLFFFFFLNPNSSRIIPNIFLTLLPKPDNLFPWCAELVEFSVKTLDTLQIFFLFLVSAEVACRGERVRDVYQRQQGYAACQTQEKVSRLECRGSCPGGAEGQGTCCTPLRSKRRKYTFQCTDGSSFVQEVEKVVKCGCTKCSS